METLCNNDIILIAFLMEYYFFGELDGPKHIALAIFGSTKPRRLKTMVKDFNSETEAIADFARDIQIDLLDKAIAIELKVQSSND